MDRSGDIDRQAFTGVLIHDGQAFDRPSIRSGAEDEVVGPHGVGLERRVGPRSATADPAQRPLARNQQAGLTSEPGRARPTQLEALALQEDTHAPVTIARVMG